MVVGLVARNESLCSGSLQKVLLLLILKQEQDPDFGGKDFDIQTLQIKHNGLFSVVHVEGGTTL